MERDEFMFSTLLLTGLSLVVFGVVHYIVAHVRKKHGALAILEINLIVLVMSSICMMLYLFMHRMEIGNPVSGLPEFVVGFGLGYIWTRVMHVGEYIPYPKGFPFISRRPKGLDITNKLVSCLMILLFSISIVISTNVVDPDTIQYLYPAAIIIAAVDMLLYTISALKFKS